MFKENGVSGMPSIWAWTVMVASLAVFPIRGNAQQYPAKAISGRWRSKSQFFSKFFQR
ncbi:MAG: hypothetical protein JWQ23_426 [Herminiimonas sp.]|nr:hypothetical protein [Herminiimonas sp.]